MQRNGITSNGLLMDQLEYHYVGLDGLVNASSTRKSNRLDYVTDSGADDGNPLNVGDIKAGMQPGNYVYDALGQLLSDESEGISGIEWRYGDKKMKQITRSDASSSQLEFVYNPFGQRVLKIEKPRSSGVILPQQDWNYTYYSYDANGQVMAVYDVKMSTESTTAVLEEQHLYGASRLGMVRQNKRVYPASTVTPLIVQHTEGQTYYELSNYLGNVEAVITDRKTWDATALYYEAVTVRTADYYPFGMLMPGRNKDYVANEYRYGYNGMEQDNEVKGNGNSYTTEFRQYDPRLGRWLSLDPLMHMFPDMSPYAAFDNNPIYYIDPYGLASTNEEGDPPPGLPEYNTDENGCEVDWKDGDSYTSEVTGRTWHNDEGTWRQQKEFEETVIVDQFPYFVDESPGGPDGVDRTIAKRGIESFAPQPPIPSANTPEWQRRLAISNYEVNLNEWNNLSLEDKWYKARKSIVIGDMRKAGQEAMRPVAQLYTIQTSLGGSGMATGLPLGTTSSSVNEVVSQSNAGINIVYHSVESGVTSYVGITNNLARRAAEHLSSKGIKIEPLLRGLSRSDARAVEQALIEIHGLSKNGGTLLNKINSISPTNPTYGEQLQRGYELLKSIGY